MKKKRNDYFARWFVLVYTENLYKLHEKKEKKTESIQKNGFQTFSGTIIIRISGHVPEGLIRKVNMDG